MSDSLPGGEVTYIITFNVGWKLRESGAELPDFSKGLEKAKEEAGTQVIYFPCYAVLAVCFQTVGNRRIADTTSAHFYKKLRNIACLEVVLNKSAQHEFVVGCRFQRGVKATELIVHPLPYKKCGMRRHPAKIERSSLVLAGLPVA